MSRRNGPGRPPVAKALFDQDGKHRAGKLDRCRGGHHAWRWIGSPFHTESVPKDDGRQTGLLVAVVARAAVSWAPDANRRVTNKEE